MKPILFNTEMTRAVRSDQKISTRRLLKPQPDYFYNRVFGEPRPIGKEGYSAKMPDRSERMFKPTYQPGDILYVREAWSMASDILGGDPGPVYAADYSDKELAELKAKHFRWRPSIHMPKEIARTFLRVTDVRVEHLQDITDAKAKAEGIRGFWTGMGESGYAVSADSRTFFDGPIGAFASLWNSTIKPAELADYGWNANPWVWVYYFERISKEEATTN